MRIKFVDIKNIFMKLPRLLGERAFLTFLGFVTIAIILGGFIFYKYSILTEKTEPEVIPKSIHFNQEIYQKILEEWEIREQKFQETDFKIYQDPFFLETEPLQPDEPIKPEELTE